MKELLSSYVTVIILLAELHRDNPAPVILFSVLLVPSTVIVFAQSLTISDHSHSFTKRHSTLTGTIAAI